MTHEIAKNRLTSTGLIANHLWLYGTQFNHGFPQPQPSVGYRFTEAEKQAFSLPQAKPTSEYVVKHIVPTHRKVDRFKGTVIGKALRSKFKA